MVAPDTIEWYRNYGPNLKHKESSNESTAASKLRQISWGYLVIRVDPHKKTHLAGVIIQDFTTPTKFKFNNTHDNCICRYPQAYLWISTLRVIRERFQVANEIITIY